MTETRRDEHLEELLADALRPVEEKLNLLLETQGEIMADVQKLNEAIDALGGAEEAAVAELADLSQELAQLDANQAPTQAQIDVLTEKATGIATALKGGTEAAAAEDVTPPVEPPVETPPVETPAAETPSEQPVEQPPVTNPPENPTA